MAARSFPQLPLLAKLAKITALPQYTHALCRGLGDVGLRKANMHKGRKNLWLHCPGRLAGLIQALLCQMAQIRQYDHSSGLMFGGIKPIRWNLARGQHIQRNQVPVSYTHLTLPTIYSV